eukprot:s7064_g4.t1
MARMFSLTARPPSNNGDKLCVARQLRLPVQEVLSDFDAITGIGSRWREQGITPREIRSFCVWRQAPMFYVDCQGRLLDKYEPAIKEQRARVAFTSWNGHAFFYKSARTVARRPSTVRNEYCNIDWLVAEEITQLDTGLWNDIACISMNRKIKFLLLGDFRQFPAIMDNFAGTPVLRELKRCQLLHDLTDGSHRELTQNMRSDPGI